MTSVQDKMGAEMDVAVKGEVSPGFESVRDAFTSNWQRNEVGASLTVYRGENKVVDLWGGYQDSAFSRPWEKDTLVNIYSTTKGLAVYRCLGIVED